MATYGGMMGGGVAAAPVRGTQRYSPGMGYVGAVHDDPNTWATDADYAAYQQAKTAPKAGPSTGYYVDPGTGTSHPYATAPQMATSLYTTTPSVDGIHTAISGQGTIGAGAYENQQQSQLDSQLHQQEMTAADAAKHGDMELAAKLQKDAESRRLGYLSTITGQQSPEVNRPGIGPVDEGAARASAFARAKEQAGQTALSSMKALHDVMASSGKMGSSVEANAEANIIGGGAHDVNDFTRTQLMSDLNRAADIGDQEYRGKITQRGQNLSLIPSLMGLITAGGGVY